MSKLINHPRANISELHRAADDGYTDWVKDLLQSGAEVDAKSEYNTTPLEHAAWRGHAGVAALLLDAGADKSESLHCAAENGHIEMVTLLLSHGSDINVRAFNDWTPLHRANRNGYPAIATLLLNAQNAKGTYTAKS